MKQKYYISDRIVVIYKGRIMEVAETEELFEFPLHPYTRSLMSAIPIPDPILEKKKKLFVYEPKEYGENEHPELVDLGNGHWLYGTPDELAHYERIYGITEGRIIADVAESGEGGSLLPANIVEGNYDRDTTLSSNRNGFSIIASEIRLSSPLGRIVSSFQPISSVSSIERLVL